MAAKPSLFWEFMLNIVMANLSTDTNMTAYWVDTASGLLADKASDIASQLIEGVCLSARLQWRLRDLILLSGCPGLPRENPVVSDP